MENCIKLKINAGDKSISNVQDKANADAYGNKFIIPLDFEMLDSAAPYYHAGRDSKMRVLVQTTTFTTFAACQRK